MNLWYFIYIWLVIINFSQSNGNNNDDDFRLPKTIIPKHYTLRVQSSLENNNFQHNSSINIQIYCIKPTNKITLHSSKLSIKSIKLIDETAEKKHKIEVENYTLEPQYDFLHIYLNDSLVENGWYRLEIDFTGKIGTGMTGYYRSSYKDKSGQTRWIAITQFESTSARTAFPCFDEPALRAQFSIQLGHRPHLTAISNMPIKSTKTNKEGWVWDTFEKTFKIPTYLVAYSINDFGFETTLKMNHYGNTIINVWTPKQSLQQVKFATEVTPKILSFFEEYFDIAYPLPKSDLLAVPNFAAGAMENWGLITFRESSLLYVPGVSTESDKNEIVNTIAHELAHYWFGDLVTIKWWTYLWLKEGFATYLARVAVGHLFPNWEIYFDSVLISDMQEVFVIDALQTSRPVSVPIHNPNTIEEIFDTISYSKGSCVIRMIELFLGNDVLRKGLKHYLNTYKYNSTEPDDLWNSLTIVAREAKSLPEKLTVKQIMDTWILQPGFPLVTVVRDYTSSTVSVTQVRFLENVRKHDDFCYWVSLTYTTKEERNFNSTKPKRWLPCPKKNITFESHNSKSWILFNVQASGLYRVNYDKTNWKMLIKQLETNHRKIDKLNRVLLIDDVMELAMAGYVDFKIAFDLVKYVRHDDQYATWSKALGKLLTIANRLDHTSHYGLIQTFISNLVLPKFEKFGGINIHKKYFKHHLQIINIACDIGNQICKQEAANIFLQWKRNGGNYRIPEEIRQVVYCEGVKSGNEEEWDYLWQYYLKSNVATEKGLILKALACTEIKWLLARYLKWLIKKDSGIMYQDATNVFASVISTKAGSHIARLFFYKNVEKLYEIQSPKGMDMKYYLELVACSLRNEGEFNEYETFLKENKKYFKTAYMTMKQMLEKIVIWKHWFDNIYPNVVHALKQQLQVTK